MNTEQNLQEQVLRGSISRRQFFIQALGLGVSLSSIGAFLAACSPPLEQAAQPAVAAPSTPVPVEPQELIIAGAKDIVGLDPVRNNDAQSSNVLDLILDTVAVLDEDGNAKPHIAESWDVSEDGLTYTYHIRKGIKCHDGSELTADDMVFTIDRTLEDKYPEGRKKEKIGMIDSYEKIDDYTVEITLQFAYAPFAAAFGAQYITPKAAVEQLGDDDYNKAPIGCGPFKFVEWKPNDFVALEGFDDYWMVKPRLDKVTIRPIPENSVAVANLIAGDVDVISDVVGTNLRQLREAADKGIEIDNMAGGSYFFAGFRMLTPPFTDLRFRQAVYMATDFDASIGVVFPPELGERAYTTVPPGLWPRDKAAVGGLALKQDKEKAKQLFQELIDEGVMPKDFKVTVAPPPDDARTTIAEIMVTDLQEIGINAELLQLEWATFLETLQGDINLIYMLGTTPSIPDPDANIRWLFGQEGSHGRYLNITHFEQQPEWEAAITLAQQSRDHDERAQVYDELVRTMMKEVVHIPLYHKSAVMAKHTYVKDLGVSAQYRWDLVRPWANVYVEGKE